MKYLYSNALGTYVFDDNFRLIERKPFAIPEMACQALERNEWTEEEKSMVKKYKGKLIFLGFKKEKIIPTMQDVNKLDSVTVTEDHKRYKKIITAVTKEKIKNSFSEDLIIIQVSSHLEELNRVINSLVKRLREWYGIYNPSLSKIEDNEKLVNSVLDKKQVSDAMGAKLNKDDLLQIESLAASIQNLYSLKKEKEKYLEKLMKEVCPNLNAVAGAAIGAKLMALVGSLRKLSELPASTIQILGAERALFRHLRNHSQKMPKYGILYQHQLVASSEKNARGKAARALADKIAIAVKVDYFNGKFIGSKLLEGLEKRFGK
jgi:nucleolar protein 56